MLAQETHFGAASDCSKERSASWQLALIAQETHRSHRNSQHEDMGNLDYKLLYQRNLPHFQPIRGTFFITFRLAGSLPQAVLRRWASENVMSQRQRKRLPPAPTSGDVGGDWSKTALSPEQAVSLSTLEMNRDRFIEFETLLHRVAAGPTWLADDRVAKIVAD